MHQFSSLGELPEVCEVCTCEDPRMIAIHQARVVSDQVPGQHHPLLLLSLTLGLGQEEVTTGKPLPPGCRG